MVFTTVSAFLKLHEKLLGLVLILAIGMWGFQKHLDDSAAKDRAVASALAIQVAQDRASLAQVASQAAADGEKYKALLDALQKQNGMLVAAIQSDNAILKGQQVNDASLPLPDLGKRWMALIPIQTGIAATTTGITVTNEAAVSTVQQLERVPALADQLSKETQIAGNNATLLAQAQVTNGDLTKQIAGLNQIVVDSDKACKSEITSVRAEGRKNSVKWFRRGFIAGFLSGVWFSHAVGI